MSETLERVAVKLEVNGEPRTITVEPRTTLRSPAGPTKIMDPLRTTTGAGRLPGRGSAVVLGGDGELCAPPHQGCRCLAFPRLTTVRLI
jgi:hypothetical protein